MTAPREETLDLRRRQVRTRDRHALAVNAAAVGAGCTPQLIRSWATEHQVGSARPLVEALRRADLDLDVLTDHAHLLAVREHDVWAGHAVYQLVDAVSGGALPAGQEVGTWAVTAALLGQEAQVRELLASGRVPHHVQDLLTVELRNPGTPVNRGRPVPEDGWVAALEATYYPAYPAGLRLRPAADPGTSLLDRLEGQVEAVDHPFRMSVVMACHEPGPPLRTAVASVLAQSWTNLELLLVDDGSQDPTSRALVAEMEALDPRVRVLRQETNGGTYRARNAAMAACTGDGVTILDSDDWAHPRLLEAHARAFVDSPRVMWTETHGLRVVEGSSLLKLGQSAPMAIGTGLGLRVVGGASRVGPYDEVRKGADGEYRARANALLGPPTRVGFRVPLTLVRVGDDSLSSGDFRPGWRSSCRMLYSSGYRAWHEGLARARPGTPGPRPPALPAHWSYDPPAHRTHGVAPPLDVVVVGDLRLPAVVDTAAAVVGSRPGRAGLLHLEARDERGGDADLDPRVLGWVADAQAHWVLADEERTGVDALLVPPLDLMLPPPAEVRLRPDRVLLPEGADPWSCELARDWVARGAAVDTFDPGSSVVAPAPAVLAREAV